MGRLSAAGLALSAVLILPATSWAGADAIPAQNEAGLPGGYRLSTARRYDPWTIMVTLTGSQFSESDFDALGNPVIGTSGRVALGINFSSRIAFSTWMGVNGVQAGTLLTAPLQSGKSGCALIVLPYASANPDAFFSGIGIQAGVQAINGRVVIDGWSPSASPFADVILGFKMGPVLLDTSAGYLRDRSRGILQEDILPELDHTAGIDPTRRHVYQVADASAIRWGVGIRAPLFRGRVRPFLEYSGLSYRGAAGGDNPHAIAGGVRLAVPIVGRMVTWTAGAEQALGGLDPDFGRPRLPRISGFVQMSVTAPPYRLQGVVRQAPPPAPPPPPRFGVLRGEIRDGQTGEKIEGAIVELDGLGHMHHNALMTSPFGRFRFAEVKPGPATVRVAKTGYTPVTRQVRAVPGQPTTLYLQLTPAEPEQGMVRGKIRSRGGEPVTARLEFAMGEGRIEIEADADGSFEVELFPGEYDVAVRSAGFLEQSKSVELAAGELMILNLLLAPTTTAELAP